MTRPHVPDRFRGMMPIMPTAIRPDGALDEASQRRVVRYCLACGAAAIGHFGIASEFHKISNSDRERLVELILDEVAGRAPVFIGVTSPGVGMSLEYARQAERMGADLIMSSLPSGANLNAESAFAYYRTLCEATSLPVIVQDTPATSATLTAALLFKMHKEIPGVKHVKAEGRAFLEKTAEVLRLSGGRMSVIGGAGGHHLIHLLGLGVTAFMTGTEALDVHAACVRAYLDGDEARAADIYFGRILPYLDFYLEYPEELLKRMLHVRGVLDCAKVIEPAASAPMSDAEWRAFEGVLERVGLASRWEGCATDEW
jgi:dihydrodipicolinate synthase/N-acetylneuraminate lyase